MCIYYCNILTLHLCIFWLYFVDLTFREEDETLLPPKREGPLFYICLFLEVVCAIK